MRLFAAPVFEMAHCEEYLSLSEEEGRKLAGRGNNGLFLSIAHWLLLGGSRGPFQLPSVMQIKFYEEGEESGQQRHERHLPRVHPS